jgi:serine protease Do
MKRYACFRVFVTIIAVGIASTSLLSVLAQTKRDSPFAALGIGKETRITDDVRQVIRSMAWEGTGAWKDPRANDETGKGPAADAYEKVAPATVVVKTDVGHGTGFLIDPEGWVLTNHHVIDLANLDPATGVRVCTVHFGVLEDGLMRLIEDGVPAQVIKADSNKDLALLKLPRLPAQAKGRTAVPMSKTPLRPADDCIAVGHPRAAMLWTVRKGIVSSVGKWPQDMIGEVMRRLAFPDQKDRQRFAAKAGAAATVKMLITDCAINHGDSGGPLVNHDGELVGVTFAVPNPAANDGDAPRIAYHIHLDEVKQFLADRPEKPVLFAAHPMPLGTYFIPHDLDEDGTPDTRAHTLRPNESVMGLAIDLDQDSDTKNSPGGSGWDFEFTLHVVPDSRTFYDSDNDGTVDWMMTDTNRDGEADVVLRLRNGKWVREEPKGRKILDPTLFEKKAMRQRLEVIVRKLQK